MQEILVECICGAKYELDPAEAGEEFNCHECGRELFVPRPDFSKKYRELLARLEGAGEATRVEVYQGLASLGSPAVMAALQRGLYDESKTVVSTCLAGFMRVGEFGREHLLSLISEGALKMARVTAMVRELQWWDGAEILCDMIDANRFNENQVSECIKLLGEAGRQRCISTLKSVRRNHPNLAMLVDNALANYKRFDSQVNKIPDAAKTIDGGNVEKVYEMAASQRQQPKKGCFVAVLLFVGPIGVAAALLALL